MRSRNLTEAEHNWMGLVKHQPCSVCGAAGPSQAHHITQGNHFTTVALCFDCHQGPSGWHGTKVMWRILKMSEEDALNKTIANVYAMMRGQA